jgi:hypothetical protein
MAVQGNFDPKTPLRGLDPRTHGFAAGAGKSWMAGSSPAKAILSGSART